MDTEHVEVPPSPAITGIIYTHDDRASTPKAIDDLAQALERTPAHEIVVVDDGSTDGTPEAVEELARGREDIRLVRLDGPAGYGAALRAGVAAARYPFIFQVDGRNRLDVSALDAMLAIREQPDFPACDIVVGRRRRRGDTLARRLKYALFRGFCRVVFGLPVADVNCPVKLYRREVFDRVRIQSDGCFADAEILAKAGFYGLMIGEVSVRTRPGAPPMRQLRPGYFGRTVGEAWQVLRNPVFVLPDLPEGAKPPQETGADAGQ